MDKSQLKKIYFDESHYTGYNLLDRDQPYFTVSSSDIGDEEAEYILRQSFPNYGADEFKFTKIWKERKKRNICRFAENINPFLNRTYSYIIDKKFAVLTKAVDYLVEPIVRDSGFDWYKGGYCWKYVNVMHYAINNFCGQEVYDKIVHTDQKFSKNPNDNNLEEMQQILGDISNHTENEAKTFIQQLSLGANIFKNYHDLASFHGSDEMQVTTMVAHVANWRQNFSNDFMVVHDDSSNFYRRREMWEKIVGPDAPAHLYPLGDGTFVQFPLRVLSTIGVKSQQSYAIQLCDLLAGLARTLFTSDHSEDDRKIVSDIINAGAGDIVFNGIYFRPEFPDGPPSPADGPDAVDLMKNTIFR